MPLASQDAPIRTLQLDKPNGFALAAATEFYSGFVPGSGMSLAATDRLTLAFRLDRTFQAVAVELREERGRVLAEVAGSDDSSTVKRQVARMLGLDADAPAWLALGRDEPVVGKLQAEFPGFFTAAKASPYDAAVWGVISPRMNMRAAARLKIAIGERHGDAVTLHGRVHHVFPAPKALLALDAFPGLPAAKLERLKGIARAALEGKLDADRLRAMSVEEALAELQELPGVGPWTASHVLFRGAALIDGVPLVEPRVLHGLADAYGLASASPEQLLELSENWRPFRMWVCVLLARHLARIGGWNRPELAKQRELLRAPTAHRSRATRYRAKALTR